MGSHFGTNSFAMRRAAPFMGRYGRFIGGGTFGMLALGQLQRSYDAFRYRDMAGAALHAGIMGAAGYAAYHMFLPQSARRAASIGSIQRGVAGWTPGTRGLQQLKRGLLRFGRRM